MVPRSSENLFRIRPVGFKLKNRIAACRILLNIVSWILIEARMRNEKKNTDWDKARIIVAEVNPAYIDTIVSLFILLLPLIVKL